MSMRVALILGIALVVAAVLHGGLYTAGHDFVVNRYTGWYEFVPADDYEEDDSTLPTAAQCLTAHRTAATRLLSRRR